MPIAWVCAVSLLFLSGCRSQEGLPSDERTAAVDRQVQAKWGKRLSELPAAKLVAISPHNENIKDEFTWAFCLDHALRQGQRVDLEWRDVGGGGSSIEKHLLNVFERSDSADIDVLWGGGEMVFMNLTRPTGRHPEGLLQPLRLPDEVLQQVPAEFGGAPFRDKDLRWIASAASSFGFLYNAGLLKKCGIAPPTRWEDLGRSRFTDLLVVADPSQSGSVAQTYRLIVCSAGSWPQGWAKLLDVLSNAKRVSDSAGAAANAPALGDALVATCIDFYGIMRAAEAPQELAYVSPEGQTTFGPDPIGILKNPPHPELARRFVDFVMSARGQAMWALPVGHLDGPVRTVLGRLPVRRDVYTTYRGHLAPSTVDFYDARRIMTISDEMAKVNSGVLRLLVVAAAVDNIDWLRPARRRLNELQQSDPSEYARRLEQFNRLPENVDTLEKMNAAAAKLKDPKQLGIITTGWRDYFHDKYKDVSR